MSSICDVDGFSNQLERVREELCAGHLNAVRDVLPDKTILDACARLGVHFRNRVLTPVITVLHMIGSALCANAPGRSGSSFRSAWNVFGGTHVSSAALSKGRSRLPESLWQSLCAEVGEVATRASAPHSTWRGHRVVDFDGTCVSMEDNPELKNEFGVNTGRHGKARYPLARVVVAMLWGTMTIVGHAVGEYCASEWSLAASLLPSLKEGDLVVGDRGFAAAHYYAIYNRHGLQFLTRAHQRLKIGRLKRLVEYSSDDFVTGLEINRNQIVADPTLPASLPVRIIRVEARVRGEFKSLYLVTSLLDAKEYPANEIADLYAGRWRIETVLRELKVACGADVLRSKKPSGVRNEIAARILAVNVVRIIMIDAARKRGCEPTRLSFATALRAVTSTSLRMAVAPVSHLPVLYQLMLDDIASEVVPDRQGRIEPRVVCRERKHYPHLKGSRADWRCAHAAA